MFSHHCTTTNPFANHPQMKKLAPHCPQQSRRGTVIEIIDNKTKQGNILFTNILANCILPSANGGCDANTMYFDLNQNFDLLQLIGTLENKTNAEEELIKEWVKKFHIVRCRDMHHLLVTLLSIEPMVASSCSAVKLIVLDGLGSNYWTEQFAGASSKYLRVQNYKRLSDILKTFIDKYNLSILIRTVEIFGNRQKSVTTDRRNLQLYGDSWCEFVNFRYVLLQRARTMQCEHEFVLKSTSGSHQVIVKTAGNLVID